MQRGRQVGKAKQQENANTDQAWSRGYMGSCDALNFFVGEHLCKNKSPIWNIFCRPNVSL